VKKLGQKLTFGLVLGVLCCHSSPRQTAFCSTVRFA